MCGIVGVIQYRSKVPREVRHRALKILFSETMLKTEPRGKDATGLYQVHEDGDWMMTKKGQKVTDWLFVERTEKLEDPIIYSEIMDTWIEHPRELKAVIGHCRAATVGSKGRDNNDNHPFAIQLDSHNALLGIHNGTLNNHEVIFDKLPKTLPRHGSVDSEAIFHFLYHLTEAGTKPVDPDMLKYLGKRLEGAYAVIMMNSRFPDQVVTFRKERPMEYFMLAPLNMLVIASEKKFVESALEKYEFIRQMGLDSELPKLQTGTRNLLERDYRIFDASKEWPAGSPIHGDFDKISEGGIMTATSEKVLEDWRGPEKASTGSYSYSGTGSKASTGATATKSSAAAAGRSASSSAPGSSAVKTTKKDSQAASASSTNEEDDTGVVVEVEIGSEKEADRARMQAKALGVMVEYDTPAEVAKSLGIDESELEKMSGVELANRLAKFHFSFGYGAARLHNKSEVEGIRKKAKDQTERMEHILDKQKKAQNHIWEYRQLVTILLALHTGGYKLTPTNVERALAAFPDLNAARRKDIQSAAQSLLEARDTKDLVARLVECFKKAEADDEKAAATS